MEENNLPAAFNQSIYFMLTVPYLAMGVVGWLIWRGCRRNEEYLAAVRAGEIEDGGAEPHPTA